MMVKVRSRMTICLGVLILTLSGCADLFLSSGSLFSNFGDGLSTVGTCLSPLEPIDLNAVFLAAPFVEWTQGTAEVTDAPAPDVETVLSGQLGKDVEPAYYLSFRFFQLGAINRAEVIEVEPLTDLVSRVYLYDAEYMLIPTRIARDFDGRRRTVRIPIPRDSDAAFLRIDLDFPSRRGEPIARLTRTIGSAPAPTLPQTVVLHFGGKEELTFRSGSIPPTRIGAINDHRVRRAAARQFREIYAPFNLTVLTDDDALPESPFSVIYIGPTDLPWLSYGLAEAVDAGNSYPDDVAIVDTDQLALDVVHVLNPETYGRALGTIAAHEMGHLLGLYHVSDPDALMTGAQCQGAGLDAERMLARRPRRAPITVASVDLQDWTIGYQDATAYLLQVLGAR